MGNWEQGQHGSEKFQKHSLDVAILGSVAHKIHMYTVRVLAWLQIATQFGSLDTLIIWLVDVNVPHRYGLDIMQEIPMIHHDS